MTLDAQLQELIEALDHTHSQAFVESKGFAAEMGMPDFVTTTFGAQRHFTRETRRKLRAFARQLQANRPDLKQVIDEERYHSVVRQALADLHAGGEFAQLRADLSALQLLDALISDRVNKAIKPFTHHFPAWTLGLEAKAPLRIGPVTIATREDWLETVDFPAELKDVYGKVPQANHNWKQLVREALATRDAKDLEGLADTVFDVIRQHRSVVSVEISGFDVVLSKKQGEVVCKGALDAISLAYGEPEYFHQQALHTERLGPVGWGSMISTDGQLWMSGNELGPRMPRLAPAKIQEGLTDFAEVFAAAGEIFRGIVDPDHHPHPNLARRWATALDWFAEGQRESNDAIALSKVVVCLDVLAQAGSKKGVGVMIEHLTGRKGTDIVVTGDNPKTLNAVVKEIYDEGRSQVLHGNKVDRMVPFARERRMASVLARILLIDCALRLQTYTGPDDEKAFQSMPELPPA